MNDSTDGAERIIAATFIYIIVALQILTAFTRAIQNSAGRCGSLVLHVAFAIHIIHEIFIGGIVPISLLWASTEILRGIRSLDALLAAIVGSLWYGPERVQSAIENLYHVGTRREILRAAVGTYHRAAVEKGLGGKTLSAPLKVRRRLRFGPWWSAEERRAESYWNGRVKKEDYGDGTVELIDGQLRSLARQGVMMAFSGHYDENSLRTWCAAMVADQARFKLSLLDDLEESECWPKVFGGGEGVALKKMFEEYGRQWTQEEWKRIAGVTEGIRAEGLRYIRAAGWVQK